MIIFSYLPSPSKDYEKSTILEISTLTKFKPRFLIMGPKMISKKTNIRIWAENLIFLKKFKKGGGIP